MFVHVVLTLLIFSGTSSSDTLVTIFPSYSLQITTGISIHDPPSSVSLMQGSFSGKFIAIHLASITRFRQEIFSPWTVTLILMQ